MEAKAAQSTEQAQKFRTSHERKVALMVRLNNVVLIATIVYGVIDKILGIMVPFYVYLAFITYAIINLFLLRYKKIEISKIYSLVVVNVMIFLVATSEPFTTGMYLHFITAGLVGMAVYGYEQWKAALAFVLLSVTLQILVFTMEFSIIPWRDVEANQARLFFVLNTVITAGVCIYIFMLYNKMNFDAEKILKANEEIILQQNDELMKANSELDRFVYSASHDLRAPLSTLHGLINLSELESNDKMKKDYLNLMKKRINSMDEFISEIIDYSRNSRLEVKQEEVQIKKLLEDVVEDLQHLAGSEEVKLYWDFPSGDITIRSDLVRLKMIFNNLISNAIKYRDSGKDEPFIKLAGMPVDNSSISDDSEISVSIEDNGIGIREDLKSQVFDMFYQAHENSTGSGLGLYIVKETLNKLSGTVSFESQKDKGSSFIVSLPVMRPQTN